MIKKISLGLLFSTIIYNVAAMESSFRECSDSSEYSDTEMAEIKNDINTLTKCYKKCTSRNTAAMLAILKKYREYPSNKFVREFSEATVAKSGNTLLHGLVRYASNDVLQHIASLEGIYDKYDDQRRGIQFYLNRLPRRNLKKDGTWDALLNLPNELGKKRKSSSDKRHEQVAINILRNLSRDRWTIENSSSAAMESLSERDMSSKKGKKHPGSKLYYPPKSSRQRFSYLEKRNKYIGSIAMAYHNGMPQ